MRLDLSSRKKRNWFRRYSPCVRAVGTMIDRMLQEKDLIALREEVTAKAELLTEKENLNRVRIVNLPCFHSMLIAILVKEKEKELERREKDIATALEVQKEQDTRLTRLAQEAKNVAQHAENEQYKKELERQHQSVLALEEAISIEREETAKIKAEMGAAREQFELEREELKKALAQQHEANNQLVREEIRRDVEKSSRSALEAQMRKYKTDVKSQWNR